MGVARRCPDEGRQDTRDVIMELGVADDESAHTELAFSFAGSVWPWLWHYP